MPDPAPTSQPNIRTTLIVLASVLATGGALGVGLLQAVDEEHQELVYGAAQDLADIDALAVAMQERSANARGYLLSGDRSFLDARNAAAAAFEARFAVLRRRHAGGELDKTLQKIEINWVHLGAASDRAMGAMSEAQQTAIGIWDSEARPLQAALAVDVGQLVAAQRARFEGARTRSNEAAHRAHVALAGIALAVVLALAWLLLQLLRSARDLVAAVSREKEQTMFRLLDEMPVAVFVADASGQPYYANQWSRRLLGRGADHRITPSQLMESYRVFEAGTEKPYPTERAPLIRALRGESSEVIDMEIRREDDVVPLHVRGAPIFDEAGKLAYAVAAFQDVRELQDTAMRDPLTGLGNRRALAQSFSRERMVHERTGAQLALAIVDLDHFKRINDTHGHPVGDVVLKRTAGCLIGALRRTDLVIRWGGEELVVVLPNTDLNGAREAMGKALVALRGETFSGAQHATFQVTFSCGVVLTQAGESLESAVARADALLYRAKQEGRDRVLAETDEA